MFDLLHVATGLGGPNAGGIQETARLAWAAVQDHARARGLTPGLVCYGDAGDAGAEFPVLSAHGRPALLGKLLARHWQARTLLFWHVGMLKLLPLLRPRRSRVLLFLHGIEAWKRFGPVARGLLRRVDLFLSNSAFTWQRFTEFNPEFAGAACRVVHLGIGEPEPGEIGPPQEPPAALMLGRMMRGEAYKGHAEVLAAWPRVPGAELWVAGDGDLRPELERQAAALGLTDRVHFFGRVTEEKKLDLLRRCRCLALPSRNEGFGLVYLEAMRLGRPCLVSDCDAGREVIDPPRAGLAADPRDPAGLVESLSRLLTPGAEWERWSHAARRRYEERFTAAHYQGRVIEAAFDRAAAPAGVP